MNLVQFAKKVDTLDMDAIISQAFEQTKEELAEINRERMDDGIKGDGTYMPKYSFISQTVYGYPDTRIKLKATGDFQNAIRITIDGTVIKTDSADEKSRMLQDRYGESIFGTFGPYKLEYNKKYLSPAIIAAVKNKLGLKSE